VVIERLVLRVVLAVPLSASLCIIVLSPCALIDIPRRIRRIEYTCVG
jgi:hypothetical protein